MVSKFNNNGAEAAAVPGGVKGANLKKGPWTAAEDAVLTEYVKKHGEGNWNCVQKNSGLMRCGKSCRLRWANHLRPNLKKGSFTADEEKIIIELHANLGNKWARMASQLPGRTDNEIKNYWNTRIKRRQRAGLPIYPQKFQVEEASTLIQQQRQPKQPKSSSPSLPSNSRRPSNYNPSIKHLDPISFSGPLDPLKNRLSHTFYSNSNHQFKLLGDSSTNSCSLALPPSPISPYAPSPTSNNLLNQKYAVQAFTTKSPSLPPEFESNMSFTSLRMGAPLEANCFIPGLKPELPSDQTKPPPTTPVNDKENDTETTHLGPNGNSGLLDALLQEAKTLSCIGPSDGDDSSVVLDKGKRVMNESTEEDEQKAGKRVRLSSRNGSDQIFGENQCADFIRSSQSSTGMSASEEGLNSMDDDLLSLISNFRSSEPLPDWYHQSLSKSDGLSSEMLCDNGVGPDVEQEASQTPATPNLRWALGSCYWNNMPGIC